MTLGELFTEAPVNCAEEVSVRVVDGSQTVAIKRGMWMQDHILELSEYEVIGYQWSKMAGWKVTVATPLPFC